MWSGSDLQISPSAGFYGDSNGATSGTTAYGRKRYLNLHQCLYDATSNKLSEFTAVSTNAAFQAGTNASNTADTARVCGAGGGGYTFDSGISGVEALDLLGNRYLNLHQCVYFNSANNDLMTTAIPKGVAAFQAPTNTSNTADTTESCPNTAAGIASGWQQTSVQSGLAAYDLRANRYLNVHQCVWNNSAAADAFTVIASNGNTPTGTNASNTADTTRVCGTKSGWSLSTTHSGVAPYDLLDTARGAGYVQYALTAPATPSPAACASTPFSGTEAFTQSGTYQSAETSAASSTGNLTVDFSALADPCPTNPIPSVDPVIGGAILATAGAGYLLYRQRRVVAA